MLQNDQASGVSQQSSQRGNQVSQARVLLADDQAEMLKEVRGLLLSDYDIVGTASNGAELVEAARRLQPDLIISDISMPQKTGFEAAAEIRALGLTAKLIFLTVQSSPAYLKKAHALGADGYVLKVHSNEQLPQAVSQVLQGGRYVSPQLSLNSTKFKFPQR
jgi:DNA-binding NarL/FixJ family response regulator